MEDSSRFLHTELGLSVIGKCFSQSLLDVTSTMSGFEFSEVGVDPKDDTPSTGQITGVMILLGENSSMFSLSISKEASFQLVSYMTGISPSELSDEDLFDGVMELTNMVAGRSKLVLADTPNYFKLTSPIAISGDNTVITHKSKVAYIVKNYRSGEMVITMKLFFL